MLDLLRIFSWRELRHHPWRNAAAVVAVMLGVALAFSVHLINASALSEFSGAVRSVNGEPDLSLRAVSGGFDETLYGELARHPSVLAASPVVEVNTYALPVAGERKPLRILGVDALVVARVAPSLMPIPFPESPIETTLPGLDKENTRNGAGRSGNDAYALFSPDTVFLNARAMALLRPPTRATTTTTTTTEGRAPERPARPGSELLSVQTGMRLQSLRVAGTVMGSVAGNASSTGTTQDSSPALAVMDIAAVQELFGKLGQLSRIDVRLQAGADQAAFLADMQALPGFAGQITVAEPGDANQRISALSRAYRVNLTVLALVALFTGAFLVFSVLSLSVAKRAQQFALLGVLGLTPAQRMRLVLCESVILGGVGSVLGLALGTGLAAVALAVLGGDLGGGYFPGVTPRLQWSTGAALVYGVLGLVAAGVGGWWPALQAQRLPPAQTLKGLGLAPSSAGRHRWFGIILIAIGALLACAPPVFDIPLGAYVSVAVILLGGISALPGGIALLFDAFSPLVARRVLPMLAVERARRQRDTAAVAISGVVASLSLAVALTVMVTSFRESVTAWLDVVLPAGLYVRMANSATAGDSVYFEPGFVEKVALLPGVKKLTALRVSSLQLDPVRPPVALISRPLDNPLAALPLVGTPVVMPKDNAKSGDAVPVFVSEAFADLYGVHPGEFFKPFRAVALVTPSPGTALSGVNFFVAGIWRDYARQHGSIAIDQSDFVRLTGDQRVNDLALWLQDGVAPEGVQGSIRKLADANFGADSAASALLEFSSAAQIRAVSLEIFDRSFAVTYWLQAVAIAIGLFGVAASFSAQVLARRKEFGLLAHLGLTRRQVLSVVAGEGLAWTGIGAIAGLVLGLVVAIVLVDVVNPQSFHWTMDLAVPWLRLSALCAAVVLAGTGTAWLAGRAAAGKDAVLAVKEDW